MSMTEVGVGKMSGRRLKDKLVNTKSHYQVIRLGNGFFLGTKVNCKVFFDCAVTYNVVPFGYSAKSIAFSSKSHPC